MPSIQKAVIALLGEEVAPRFDLCTEIWLGTLDESGEIVEQRTLVLPKASADELCQLIVRENVKTLVCGGIEEEYYEYLNWKKVRVLDSVIATKEQAQQGLKAGTLTPGTVMPL